MTAAALVAAQIALHAQIEARAVALGYDAAKVAPIYDGVVDAGAYLAARPRVMWILKEPYDDFDAEGNPQGGGWTMFKDIREGDTLAATLNRNTALRNVAYASAAILGGGKAYAGLPWISEKPAMSESAIQSMAYANVGKMPGETTTSTARLRKIAANWKDILFKQIAVYDPDVLIVCGTDTLQVLNADFGLDLANPPQTVKRGNAVVDVHVWRGKRLLWAPHPAARIRPEDWVDAVVEAVRR